MKPLIIFDCDGVLIDSEGIACRVEAEVLSECGASFSEEDVIREFVGVSEKDMLLRLRREFDIILPEDYADRVNTRFRDECVRHLEPMDGILELLDALTNDRCVASSSSPERLDFTLGLTGLLERFSGRIYSSTMVERGKPAPDLFLFAAEQMGYPPEACIVVEDSIAGVQAAKAAGMRVIGFLGGSHIRKGHKELLLNEHVDSIGIGMRDLIGSLGSSFAEALKSKIHEPDRD